MSTVSPALHAEIVTRDGRCFVSRLDPQHVCRDRWGLPHAATELHLLTVDHVKRHARMGVRAESIPARLVAMCWGANVGVPSREVREAERSYLAMLYPADWL